MVSIPQDAMNLLNDPKSIRVLGTKTEEGNIHIIQAGSIKAINPQTIIIGAILMKNASKNLETMKKKNELASILVSKETASYEVKVSIKDYQTSGPIFDKLNEEIKKIGLAARGVWILEPKEVWNQSASYEAGKRIA